MPITFTELTTNPLNSCSFLATDVKLDIGLTMLVMDASKPLGVVKFNLGKKSMTDLMALIVAMILVELTTTPFKL
ncbi:hypothetical protein KF282_1420 [Lactococcus lactis subsp. lactis]|uniref:Uncharacterized protein n=1 Tax=Lactococcus lactis subsp. lactis TaxID=1360 RepID=A0A0V8CT68_LACLL|nr:hypothetical protein KF282_1420 [Lactococcus lactis subsp. lactis]